MVLTPETRFAALPAASHSAYPATPRVRTPPEATYRRDTTASCPER
jgi:hypothetical protein